MLLNVQFLTGQRGVVQGIEEEDTVADLKAKIAEHLDFAPPPEKQKLLYGGRLLNDNTQVLADLDIFADTCIMCVSRPVVPPPQPANADETRGGEKIPAPAGTKPAPNTAATSGKKAVTPAPEVKPIPQQQQQQQQRPTPPKPPVEPMEEEMIALSLKTLRGTHTLIEVPAHATFGHIKHKYIQPIEDIPAIQMRLIYMGQLTDDSKTPFEYKICKESFVHLVRRPNESILSEVITPMKLRANCRWCNKAGVQLKLRPQCRECNNEGALYKDRVIEVNKSKWSDLIDLKGICFSCKPSGKEVDLSMGFLCTGQPGATGGASCPGRLPGERKMLATYHGGDLVHCLNEIFGYAHARGYEV